MTSFFYKCLKVYCTTALKFYFRKWQVQGLENIPPGAVLFIPNHQNAFLDAVIVTCSSSKNPWFMTRADVFSTPLAIKILNQLQMIPVFRFRDGYSSLKNNESTMNGSVEKLNNGETIIIFAEGNHGAKAHLRKLQKGFARIAFETKPEKNIAVVPVGLHYESHWGFRSDVLVNFGKPVLVNDYKFDESNKQFHYEELISKVEMELKKLMLHIELDDYESRQRYLKNYRRHHKDLHEQLKSDREIIANYPQQHEFPDTPKHPGILHRLLKSYFDINTIPARLLIRKLILSKIKDPQFVGSIKFASGMIIVPLFTLVQAGILFLLTGSLTISAVYLFSIPLSLRFS